MSLETISQIIAVIAPISTTILIPIVVIMKNFYDIGIGNKTQSKENYKFIKDFVEDRKNNPDLHPLVVERGYQIITGLKTVNIDELDYVLSLRNPDKRLKNYLSGKEYLDTVLDSYGNFKFTLKKKKKRDSNSSPYKWRKRIYFVLYMFFAFVSFAPLFIPPNFGIILTLFCTPYAWWFLDRFCRISSAERLVKNQQKHRSNIHLPSNNSHVLK